MNEIKEQDKRPNERSGKGQTKGQSWLDSPQRWTIEIWTWTVLTAVVVVLSILFSGIWAPISIVYLAIVSNYALVLTAASARQASLARLASENGGSPTLVDIMEFLVTHTTLEKSDTE